jgi:hypothetical protein
MKEITFRCNFCREQIKDADSGIGVRWAGTREDEHLTVVPLHDSESHLCECCLRAIQGIDWQKPF